eukprot:SAG11_NODE_18403_length_492_cov_0.791349_1_plen_146_part_10
MFTDPVKHLVNLPQDPVLTKLAEEARLHGEEVGEYFETRIPPGSEWIRVRFFNQKIIRHSLHIPTKILYDREKNRVGSLRGHGYLPDRCIDTPWEPEDFIWMNGRTSLGFRVAEHEEPAAEPKDPAAGPEIPPQYLPDYLPDDEYL